MKIMKKIAAAALASAALFAFVGCADSDDPEGAIKKVNNKTYTIEYDNTGSKDIYRCYHETALKHSGGLFVVELNDQSKTSEVADGVMGVIFDMKKGNKAKDFYVIGVNYGYTDKSGVKHPGKIGYYASRYRNITNIQADNFGATGLVDDENSHVYSVENLEKFKDDTEPAELVLTQSFKYEDWNVEDGTVKAVINVEMNAGAYKISVYTADALNEAENAVKEDAEAVLVFDIPAEITGYTKKEQGNLAFYANVYGGRKLSGTWRLPDAQNYIQVVEE